MELIDQEAAIATYCHAAGCKKVYGVDCEGINCFGGGAIASVPTIAAAPAAHGRWVMRGGRFHCSACDAKALWRDVGGTGGFSHEYEQATTDVCPYCGCKMDGGEEHGL